MDPLFKNEETRCFEFDKLMEPVLHLAPSTLAADLKGAGFFTAPASTKYHGNYEGGLFDHSYNVTRVLLDLTNDCHLIWEREESPYIIGMFHDLCKVDSYRHPVVSTGIYPDGHELYTTDTTKWEHSPDTILKGHGDKSVMLLSYHFRLTMEEILCIRYHMGAFVDQREWNDYTRAIHVFPNVLWTHQADMIATHIVEV